MFAGARSAYQLGQYLARRTRMNSGRSYTQTKTKKRKSSGKGVTFQHDRQLIYQKRRMPYRKKKKWIAFKQKVNAISEKELGTQTVVFNRRKEFNYVNMNNHGLFTLALYPNTSGETWLNDIRYLHQMDNTNDPTSIDGTTVDETTKYMFQSAVLDVTMRNTSFSAEGLDRDCSLEVDIYEMTMSRKAVKGTTQITDLKDVFSDGYTDTKDIKNTGVSVVTAGITPEKRGVTPFDCPQALAKYRIKILKKTKLFISNGQTSTYQMRDPTRHVVTRARLGETPGVNMPGMTKFLYITFKAVPGIDVPATTPQLDTGITRKYMYKIEGRNATRDLHLQA